MHFSRRITEAFVYQRQRANPHAHELCKNEGNSINSSMKTNIGYALTHLVILVCSNCNEVSFGEHIGSERAVRKFQNVVCSHNVKPRLILMHGVQNRLRQETMLGFKDRSKHFHFTHYT